MTIRDWISTTRQRTGRFIAGAPTGAYPSPDDDFWYQPFGPRTYTGVRVTQQAAVAITALDAAVSLISDTIASLPIPVYRRAEKGPGEVQQRHPVSVVINEMPNSWQTASEFWGNRLVDLLFWGNAYARILPGTNGFAGGLSPLRADCMEVKMLPNGSIGYKYREPGKPTEMIDEDLVFHVRNTQSNDNGVTGLGVMHKHPPTIGLVVAIQTYAQQLYGQGTLHKGILSSPGEMGDETIERLRKQWMKNQGLGAAGKPLIVEDGMTWQNTSMTPEDAQVLESRKFHVEEVCRMFRVPPHLVGHTEKNSSWGTGMSDLTAGFLKFTLRPPLTRIEQAISRDLIQFPGLFYPKYNVDELLRADIETRYKSYSIGKQWGFLTSDEIRTKEGMGPIPGGDVIWQPVNMQPASGESTEEFALGRQFIKDAVNRNVQNECNWLREHFSADQPDHESISKADGYFGRRVSQITKHLHVPESDAEDYARYASFSVRKAVEDGQEQEMINEWARTAERKLMASIFRTIQ